MYPASTDSLEFVFFGNKESGKFDGIEKDHVRFPFLSLPPLPSPFLSAQKVSVN